jgi:hypothetical protein
MMNFEHMNAMQRRLHNAAGIIDVDGFYDDEGYAQVLRDAIDEIQRLRVLGHKDSWVDD